MVELLSHSVWRHKVWPIFYSIHVPVLVVAAQDVDSVAVQIRRTDWAREVDPLDVAWTADPNLVVLVFLGLIHTFQRCSLVSNESINLQTIV
jgi:hypothetical protein